MDPKDASPGDAATFVATLHEQAKSAPAVDQAARAEELEAISRKMIADGRKAAAIAFFEKSCPPDYLTSDWNHPKMVPWSEQIQRILSYTPGDKGFIASGPTGRGKSRAMHALFRRMAYDLGLEVRTYTAFDWFAQLQGWVAYGRDDAKGWVEAVARRPFVFIDDLGQEALQTSRESWAYGWFFRFLDIRVGEKLPLFITTNLTAELMAARAGDVRGDPLVRRLLEVCEPVVFESPEEKARRKTRK